MRYKGKKVEIIKRQKLFTKETLWVRVLDDNSLIQILEEELEDDVECNNGLALARFIAIAANIKQEIAKKHILAPYESSLIPLPHQILVLEKVMQGIQTRFLLADEVGMGKTIEAGLVLKEKKLRGEVNRVLLIVPKSAMLQWKSEMKNHFAENFIIYDNDMIASMSKAFSSFEADDGMNFWRQHNQIIVSSDALKPVETRQGWSQERVDEYNKSRLEMVINADFDMVIIDEAHKMGGSTGSESRYKMAEAICNAVPNLLLLSGTPHRGKSDHFRRVLQLIDADAFAGEGMPSIEEIQPYVIRNEKRYAVDYDGHKLFNNRSTIRINVELDRNRHAQQMELYEDITNYVRICFRRAQSKDRNATGLVMVMLQKLASSSTEAVLAALRTRLQHLEAGDDADKLDNYGIDGTLDYEPDEMNVNDFSVDKSKTTADDEKTILEKLIRKAELCRDIEEDAKATALINKIRELNNGIEDKNKILVFTEFYQTQDYLMRILTKQGLKCVKVNGLMSIEERHYALVDFHENADVMIATDAAGESLNMQFCHIIINYDMPWNPMVLEQRIGRVDRIGQKHEVQAYNMLTNNSVDYRVYEIIVEKLDRILKEMGIDKTSDVLDSTIDVKKINHIYLQSLLDPSRFDFVSDSWLYDIKQKLNKYNSTEGALPTISSEEINAQSASEIKYSPLPVWLENMMANYCQAYGYSWQKDLFGATEYKLGNGYSFTAVFDAEKAADNPGAEQVTLQHPFIRQILNEVDAGMQGRIPVLHMFSPPKKSDATEIPINGYLTIWKVTATNEKESRTIYVPLFIFDNDGPVFGLYGNSIWNKLIENNQAFQQISWQEDIPDFSENEKVQKNLIGVFNNMENGIKANLYQMAENKLKALDFSEQRINRIGIENIRKAKLERLEKERQEWNKTFEKSLYVAPDIKLILAVKING